MENEVLNDIKEYAKCKLIAAYGTIGIAENDNLAMLNAFLGEATIKVTIEVVDD